MIGRSYNAFKFEPLIFSKYGREHSRILANSNKHEYSNEIGDKLFNLYHHTPTFGHVFLFDAVPVSEDTTLQQMYVDPLMKSTYLVMQDKDANKSGFFIHSDGSIQISNSKIIEVPELRNSIQENKTDNYIKGRLDAHL